jgi:hypothetical protein
MVHEFWVDQFLKTGRSSIAIRGYGNDVTKSSELQEFYILP